MAPSIECAINTCYRYREVTQRIRSDAPLEARWDETSDEARKEFERGRVLVSLCSYRAAGGVRHATVWRAADGAPEQRFEPDVEAERAASVLAMHARDGYHPALIGMVGPAARPVIAFVLERGAPGALAPTFVSPRPFRGEDGALFVAQAPGRGPPDAGYLRSIAAAGAPEDARGTGLVVAGVWAPQPPVRIAWAVHLDRVDASDPCWRARWEPRTLETVARPVLAMPIASTGVRWVLSLWHDRLIEPWPAPDPFARTARFAADEAKGAAALARAVAARRDLEDRCVMALGAGEEAGGTRFLALYGARGTEAALGRRFVAVGPGDEAPSSIALDEASRRMDEEPVPDHPLDRWMLRHLRETGARHAQLVIVRGRRLAFARAYTFAEAGYPVARLDDAMRIGSVSKALTTVALLATIARRGLRDGIDARATGPDVLGFAAGEGPPRLAAVTLRHLLTHQAGFRTFAAIRPDEPQNPLSEHRLTELLDGAPGPARPGQLTRGLQSLRDDAVLARAPGGGAASGQDYSNEGFILLGEILAHIDRGSCDCYEDAVVAALLRPAGVDPKGRGCLLGAGRRRARARREAPAHPSSPTWAEKRFAGDDLDEGPLVLEPYADNGPFLAGAAGWCVPLVWIARVLAALGPRHDRSGLWQRSEAELAATPAAQGSRQGHGVHLGEPGFWTLRSSRLAPLSASAAPRLAPVTIRVARVHHSGRIEGGAALLVHQMPMDAADDALDATLGIALAFNQLGPLQEDPHGRELLAVVRSLEGSPGWDTEDLFNRIE